MESKIEKVVTLKLNEQEAKWLKLLLILSRKEIDNYCVAQIRKEQVTSFLSDDSSKILLFTEPDGHSILDSFLSALEGIDVPISEGA